jgi:hypothetical protein
VNSQLLACGSCTKSVIYIDLFYLFLPIRLVALLKPVLGPDPLRVLVALRFFLRVVFQLIVGLVQDQELCEIVKLRHFGVRRFVALQGRGYKWGPRQQGTRGDRQVQDDEATPGTDDDWDGEGFLQAAETYRLRMGILKASGTTERYLMTMRRVF